MEHTLFNRAIAEYQTLCRKNRDIMVAFKAQAVRICASVLDQQKLTDRTCPTDYETAREYNVYVTEQQGQFDLLEEQDDEESSMGMGLKNLASPMQGMMITNVKNQYNNHLDHQLSEFK